MTETNRDIVNPRRSGGDGRNVGHPSINFTRCIQRDTTAERTSDVRSRHPKALTNSNPNRAMDRYPTPRRSHPPSEYQYQVTYMDRQSARMTLGWVEDGDEKGDYIIFNIGDALHLLHFDHDEGVRSHFCVIRLREGISVCRIRLRPSIFDVTSFRRVIASLPLPMTPMSLLDCPMAKVMCRMVKVSGSIAVMSCSDVAVTAGSAPRRTIQCPSLATRHLYGRLSSG